MAIAYDNSTTANAFRTNASSLTFSHTTSGSNRLLVVGVHTVDANSRTITGVTYNGVAMTSLYEYSAFSQRRTGMFYLINPASGANNVVITLSGATASPGTIEGAAISFTGVFQTAAGFPDSNSKTDSTGTSISATTTANADQNWIVGVFSGDANAITAGVNTTIRSALTDADGGIAVADSNQAFLAGSRSLAGSFSSQGMSLMIGSIAPVIQISITDTSVSSDTVNIYNTEVISVTETSISSDVISAKLTPGAESKNTSTWVPETKS
jgi:hypothetical protein